ncbi:MAG: winged helix-turn-helix domain-containing protein [Chloroflexota bacterium]
MTIEISALTARRYVMGRGGLWPGRRWQGLDGTRAAMRAMEDLQLDPLVIVARAHDLMLHSRVTDYAIDDWAVLTYERREFFEWGGWLAVRPMDELPYFRVLMRREREKGHWLEVERDHHDAIEEMRALLRSGREVSNRSFEMSDRKRIDHYRGRKDSALALHYLWRVGEAMVARRDRFERVYALTEAVAPASALREVDEAEADHVLARKAVAAAGLAKLSGINTAYVNKLKAGGPAELDDWRLRGLADGSLVDVRVEGWRTPQIALGEDAAIFAELEAGRVPAEWAPIGPTTTDEVALLSPLDPVSARGRAKPLFGFDYVWEVYKPVAQRKFGYYTMPFLWGDRLVGRFDPKLDRTTGTLVILGLWLEDAGTAKDAAFVDALAASMRRFMTLLDVTRVDVAAVGEPRLRRALARTGKGRRARSAVS